MPCLSEIGVGKHDRHGIAHNELHGLLAAHGHRGGDLLIPPDGEGAHGVAGLAKHGLLPCELLQHLQQENPS